MIKVVEHLRKAFPQASILIVGVGDREHRDEDGNLRTMPGVKNLIRYQQALAAETHTASGTCMKQWEEREVSLIW
mgnify:CR=1 FL=1